MRPPRDFWLFTGVTLVSLAGFLVLRPQPVVPVVEPPAVVAPASAPMPTATTEPLMDTLSESVNRVLATAGSAEVVEPAELPALPDSVVRVLVDRRAVLTLPEDAP